MINNTILAAFSSLIPFWSNQIIKTFALGNEYAMAINMILTEIITICSSFLNDIISMISLGIFILCISLKYFNINIFDILTNINKNFKISSTIIIKVNQIYIMEK